MKTSRNSRNIPLALGAALALSVAGCSSSDVVAAWAKKSFAAVVRASAARVAWSEAGHAWRLSSPGGDVVSLSADFSKPGPDASFSFDAAPFTAAGLDVSKMGAAAGLGYALEGGRLVYSFELGDQAFGADASKSIEAAFAEILRKHRARIGYHEKLDHYGIKLGGGNMLEWAKDLGSNDKDLVFVLDPGPFIAAGVDPAKIEGWAFAAVDTKDDSGKPVKLDKLLKPYNLE
jgi:hypothetical protein